MSAFDKVIGYRATKQKLLQICDMLRDRTIYEEMAPACRTGCYCMASRVWARPF